MSFAARRIVFALGLGLVVGIVVVLIAALTGSDTLEDVTSGRTLGIGGPPEPARPVVAAPQQQTTVLADGDADPVTRAVATSAALFGESPLVVLAPAGDVEAQARAASAAVHLGVPLLLTPEPAATAPGAAPSEGAPPGDGSPTEGSSTGEAPSEVGSAAVAQPIAGRPDPEAVAIDTAQTTPSADREVPDAEGPDAEGPDAEGPDAEGPGDQATSAPADPDEQVAAELARLTVGTVLAVGDAAARWAADLDVDVVTAGGSLAELLGDGVGAEESVAPAEVVERVTALPRQATPLLRVDEAAAATEGAAAPGAAATDSTDVAGAPTGVAEAPADSGSASATDAAPAGGELPLTAPAEPVRDVLVLVGTEEVDVAAAATARAAGARVLDVARHDPRDDRDVIAALAAEPPGRVVAVGPFGPAERLRQRLDVAATGVELPGGGQTVYPGRRMVALYGHPGTSALGVLGEQDVDAAIARANEVAAPYAPLSGMPVIPAFEIITTIASSAAGEDGDYSDEATVEELRPWVDAAREAGVYVVLDLQPGRTDFLTQAQRYTELLEEPHVGLALDPEWRLEPDQVHLRQIGSVDVEEVNEVSAWLAELTRERDLPQKLLILHQFQLRMIEGRERVDTSHDELAVLIHADGNGSLPLKLETWGVLTQDPPPGVWWGWKNFYDEDDPTPTPEETMAVEPPPLFISYQ